MDENSTPTITLIGTSNCSQCTVVKTVLREHNITFMYYDMTDLDDVAKNAYLTKARNAGRRSMPLILKDNEITTMEEILK